jgi:hypothetical protein
MTEPQLPAELTGTFDHTELAPQLAVFLQWANSGSSTPTAIAGRHQFEVRPDDVPSLNDPAAVDWRAIDSLGGDSSSGEHPLSESPAARIARANAQQLVAAIDGRRSIAELAHHCSLDPGMVALMVQSLLGRGVEVDTYRDLVRRIDPCEIVRYPVPGPALSRTYWSNCADARAFFESQRDALEDLDDFTRLLRQLNIIHLMGRRFDSFYISARNAMPATPGQFRPGIYRFDHAFFQSYARSLAASHGGTIGDEGDAVSADGFQWGQYFGTTFFYTADVDDESLEQVRGCLVDAEACVREADARGLVRALARFHQRLARLHTFPTANNVLSMTILNGYLRRAFDGVLPHLVLDIIATVVDESVYAEVLMRAVDVYLLPLQADVATRSAMTERAWRHRELSRQIPAGDAYRPAEDDARLLLYG